MGCPCPDGNGNIVEVPAKTKEMVYRAKAPNIQKAIKEAIENDTKEIVPPSSGGGKGR